MGMFSKKSKIEEAEERVKEAKRKEMEKIKKLARIELPSKSKAEKFKSTEYSEFLHESEKKPGVFYERACALSERILPIKLDAEIESGISQNLSSAFINATPKGVISFTTISTIILSALLLFSLYIGLGSTIVILMAVFAGILIYYIYNYPSSHAKVIGMRMSSDAVLAILYMVIYMRTSPNLEGALRFATQNLKGPLSWDLKKLMWDIEVGKYSSADEAIVEYVFKWKDRNKEFAEALHLLRSVATEPVRRNIIFDETINVILNGTRERAKHYASGLRMPMMIIHAMGVLLPIMGLVLFPVVMIFMGDSVKPIFIFMGYDILLPAFIYFFTDYILQSKPSTFSQPDVSLAKGIPKLGYYRFGTMDVPILPIALAIGIPISMFGILGVTNPDTYVSVSASILIIIGVSVVISAYTFLDSHQKLKIRNDIEKIEDEFSVALFQLGNLISGGSPIELAIDQARVNLKNMKITEMLEITSMNMKKFGYTFEQALFDKDVGAVWYYPSSLIRSIMQTILESSKKSAKTAGDSMMVISRYLKDVHNVKEEIDEILGETISSMKFLAMFLAPMVAGVTITMAVIILKILTSLGSTLGTLTSSSGGTTMAQSMLIGTWGMSGTMPISPVTFQMIVGIYMVETVILLSLFLNRIQYGEDAIGERSLMSKTMIISMLVYFISWIVVYSLFGGSITTLLTPIGV